MELVKMFLAGIVGIGVITAFGLHAQGLANLATSGGKAGKGLLTAAETGK